MEVLKIGTHLWGECRWHEVEKLHVLLVELLEAVPRTALVFVRGEVLAELAAGGKRRKSAVL